MEALSPGLENAAHAETATLDHPLVAAARECGLSMIRFSNVSREACLLFLVADEIWFQMLATSRSLDFLPEPTSPRWYT